VYVVVKVDGDAWDWKYNNGDAGYNMFGKLTHMLRLFRSKVIIINSNKYESDSCSLLGIRLKTDSRKYQSLGRIPNGYG